MDLDPVAGHPWFGPGSDHALVFDPRDRTDTRHYGHLPVPGRRRYPWRDLPQRTTFLAVIGWNGIDRGKPGGCQLEACEQSCKIRDSTTHERGGLRLKDFGSLSLLYNHHRDMKSRW